MQKGTISVQTENILPIIKKYLYSDQEIFLRELVANAVDATQKLQTLANRGEISGEIGDTTIQIFVDPEAKTLTISDKGVGMTQDEVVKYITQVAFSGAKEFLSQYKDATNIIGHFGLGFYSAFMVADKVEIFTKSHKDEAGVHWSCDGGTDYEIAATDKQERGTDIVLHLNDEATEYLDDHRIEELLKKYCRFLPVPIQFGTEEIEEPDAEGTAQTIIEPRIINDTQPIWARTPTDNTDEDYQNFYRQLYPFADEPLFWIHLNVDYPFNLTGVLYFPKLKGNFELDKNKIHLYCNQVFVTDQVENIVPQFLTLLHGVIDSPDIPLNVSRSYLQSDPEVKKINKYITKKVADKLDEMFKSNRSDFEEKWKDISLLIKYGVLTDDKFAERADKFSLLTNVDNKSFTLTEYVDHIKAEQTDKNNKIIALYTTNADEQHAYIETARSKGYDVLLMNQQLDGHYMQYVESKPDSVQFKRVDADT
ncbi:MAG TPA: molecular chaperone HtpG, partial [Chitinophagales bacterium]|nr:molecular chaperone HtpG [Chitinophagales bacterium]